MSKPVNYTAEDCKAGIIRHAVREHTHRIMQGYWLLQARAIYALPAGGRGQGRKSSATVALDLHGAESPGFEQWLAESLTQDRIVSRRTAFNYMQAALNCGIHAGIEEAEAERLAAEKLAEIAGISSLYKPPGLEGDSEPEKRPKGMTQGDLFLGWEMQMDNILTPESEYHRALPLLPVQKLDEMERKLRTALDLVKEAKTAALKGAGKGAK